DLISRYYEYRRTPWVFGTSESIHDIFSTGGFFGESPLSSILHEPEGIYSQSSTIKPIQFHRFISYFFEPGCTTIVPTLSINKVEWKEGSEVEPKLMISGAIFLKNKVFQSNIPLKELSGLRWVQEGSKRAGISVPSDTDASLQIVFREPKVKFK